MSHNLTQLQHFNEAVALHHQSVQGSRHAAGAANERFARLLAAVPQSGLLTAYYGSTFALLGRDATDPEEGLRLAQQGLQLLDQAVALDPAHPEIRLIRAHVCLQLPETFFHRAHTAAEDLSYLLARQQADPASFTPQQSHDIAQLLHAARANGHA